MLTNSIGNWTAEGDVEEEGFERNAESSLEMNRRVPVQAPGFHKLRDQARGPT